MHCWSKTVSCNPNGGGYVSTPLHIKFLKKTFCITSFVRFKMVRTKCNINADELLSIKAEKYPCLYDKQLKE